MLINQLQEQHEKENTSKIKDIFIELAFEFKSKMMKHDDVR